MSTHPLKRLLTAVLWTGLLAAANLTAADATIVKDGKPTARIVVAEKPTRMQWMAAFELRDHLRKMTGAELPIDSKPATDGTVNVFVGDSPGAKAVGVTSKGRNNGAYRMVSGKDWLALIGNDENFEPIEPWARHYTHGKSVAMPKWDEITGKKWSNLVAMGMYRKYTGKAVKYEKDQQKTPTKSEDIQFWEYDKKGSLNAVYAFLRRLGVRWYMPGDLGEILPKMTTIELPKVEETVEPDMKIRAMSWDRAGSSRDQLIWSLRLGLNDQFTPAYAHGLAYITNREEQRKLHPEFFQVLPNGKRDNESRQANACLSSPALLKEHLEYARTIFDMYDVSYVGITPQDGFTRICQCEQCRDKETPERGNRGRLSDYVWEYANKFAREVAKTHPDKKIYCGAYSTYQLPPTKIDKLEPNLVVSITNGRPRTEMDPEWHKELDDMRRGWLAKTDNPMTISINYHFGILPLYVPHVIAKGLNDVKGQVSAEDNWYLPFGKKGLYNPAVNHLAVYLTSRLYWDQDADAEAILDEYYAKFYGPAKDEMKAFVNYVEANYGDLTRDPDKVNKAFELFEAVKDRVDPETVYGKRVALIDEALETWRTRKKQLSKRRGDTPYFSWLINCDKSSDSEMQSSFTLDGKLDERFWRFHHPYTLRYLKKAQPNSKAAPKTHFRARWYKHALYVGIRCEEDSEGSLKITTTKRDDPAILDGDHVQVLLETTHHSYYQIAVNPAGALLDRDLGVEQAGWNRWDSQAEVAIHKGDGFWSVEIRIPVTTSDTDPLHEVIGHTPTGQLPWFFNVCRQRVRGEDVELSSYSPVVGEGDFDDPKYFAKIALKGTNRKEMAAKKLAKQKALKEKEEKKVKTKAILF